MAQNYRSGEMSLSINTLMKKDNLFLDENGIRAATLKLYHKRKYAELEINIDSPDEKKDIISIFNQFMIKNQKYNYKIVGLRKPSFDNDRLFVIKSDIDNISQVAGEEQLEKLNENNIHFYQTLENYNYLDYKGGLHSMQLNGHDLCNHVLLNETHKKKYSFINSNENDYIGKTFHIGDEVESISFNNEYSNNMNKLTLPNIKTIKGVNKDFLHVRVSSPNDCFYDFSHIKNNNYFLSISFAGDMNSQENMLKTINSIQNLDKCEITLSEVAYRCHVGWNDNNRTKPAREYKEILEKNLEEAHKLQIPASTL